MAVKGSNGNDPDGGNLVLVPFRSSTASSGGITWREVASALSLTISSGSTLGHNSGLLQYIYWYLLDNSGTVELAASFKYFGRHGIVSTTAEGGAGAADTGTTMYSASARTNVPFVCIGYSEDTQTTAGTWASAPSAIHLAPFELPVISFRATKDGTAQTIATGSGDNKLTFATTVYNNGSLLSSNTFTPPPGKVLIVINVYIALSDTDLAQMAVYKNGSPLHSAATRGSASGNDGVKLVLEDECDGNDTYEAYIAHDSSSNQDVSGSAQHSYWTGSWSPGRS